MHYLGMWALEVPGDVTWSADLVAGVDRARHRARGACAGRRRSAAPTSRGTVAAAVLLTLAIVSHHFTAMGAVEIVPDPMLAFADNGLSPGTLALAVAPPPSPCSA